MRALLLLALFAGCKQSGQDKNDDSNAPLPDDSGTTPDDSAPSDDSSSISGDTAYELTLDPSLARAMTAAENPTHLFGRVLDLDGAGMPTELGWSVTHDDGSSASGDGTVTSDGLWSADVALSDGDNVVEVSVPDGYALRVEVTYNEGYTFGGPLTLDQSVAYLGESREVTASIVLPDPDTDPLAVRLVTVDGDGKELASVPMLDDGNVSQGDTVGGDGIYHARISEKPSKEGLLHYRVVLTRTSGAIARSAVQRLLATAHVDPKRFAAQVAAGASYRERVEGAATDAEKLEVVAQIRDELAKDPTVLQVELNADGRGVWMLYDNGIAALVAAPLANERSGAAGTVLEPTTLPPPANEIESARVLAYDAVYYDFAKYSEVAAMADLLYDNACSVVDEHYGKSAGSSTVEQFKNLSRYGMVLISTHGNTYYDGLLSEWIDRFGWDRDVGEIILDGNHHEAAASLATYEDDLKTGRLVLCEDGYCVTPTFIRHYMGGRLPNSLVYVSACRSGANGSLASAFLESGAGAFLGYSDFVQVSFAHDVGTAFMEALMEPGTTVGDAFVPGQVETDADPAEFRLFGDSNLEPDFAGLQDGNFESGNLDPVWGGGDGASAVPSLFDTSAPEGSWMAMVTSGIGDTLPATIQQSFCLEKGQTTVSFDWKFVSEDKYTGVNPDHFVVSIQAETYDKPYYFYQTILDESVDTLGFDMDPIKGVGFTEGCDKIDCLEETAWQRTTYVIPDTTNMGTVTLKLSVNQGGGGESVALVDNIRITP